MCKRRNIASPTIVKKVPDRKTQTTFATHSIVGLGVAAAAPLDLILLFHC